MLTMEANKWLPNDLQKKFIEDREEKIKTEAACLTKETKIKWLLMAIKHLDLTSLAPDDSTEKIKNLCLKAARPIDIVDNSSEPLHTAAICIYPTKVKDAVNIFQQNNIKGIKIASVGAGFPTGNFPLDYRLDEIREAVKSGADEIDVVIDRDLVTNDEWDKLSLELQKMREACGTATMKTILSTGELGSMDNIYKASKIAMTAGSDFVKTSTGKEVVNATLPVGIVMCKAIKDFHEETGRKIGFKPAGGIKTAEDVLRWLMLIKCELGEEWLTPKLFRIGASSVLDDIVETYQKLIVES